MSLWKRNGWYCADFTVNGTRYRVPLETKDVREAKAAEKDKITEAKQGVLAAGRLAALARLNVDEAFNRFLPQRQAEVQMRRAAKGMADPIIEASYAKSEVSHAKPLIAFFKGKRLRQISADDIQQYQSHRLRQGKAPKTINHESKLLLQLLKRAKLLSRIREEVALLPLSPEPRQMLTQAQKQQLFETAASRPEWLTAYCAALLTANTTMRPIELRRLLWQDLDPFNRLVTVRRSKTDAGTRIIPVNEEAWSAFAALKQRADALGTYAPEHYIFHRLWPHIDATRPMTSWRSAWRTLRKVAGLPRMRYYDLRHQATTEMLEGGAPEGVIREVAGHIDPEMTRHYSHPRLAARRAAVGTISSVRISNPAQIEGGYVTNRVTKAFPENIPAA